MAARSGIISKSIGGVVLAAMVVGGSILGVNVVNGANAERAHLAAQKQASALAFSPGVAPANQTSTTNQLDALSAQAMVDAKKQSDADAAAAAKAAAVKAAQAAAQQAAAAKAADTIVKCPAGTHAMKVDANGNESNCDPLNGSGQPCEAYNDANQCTAWLQE